MKIYKAINAVMKDLGAIAKGRTNTHQNYAFRGIEDFYNSIHPELVNKGIFIATQVVDKITETHQKGEKTSFRVLLQVNHKFYAEDGSFVEVITSGEGIDTSDKATSKAMSMAMKYAFIQTFSIPTQDMSDPERDSPSVDQTNPKKPEIKTIKSVTLAEPARPMKAQVEEARSPAPSAWDSFNSYRVPFGKTTKGKTLEEIGVEELANCVINLQNDFGNKNKPIVGQYAEFIAKAEAFVRAKRSTPAS